MNTGCGTGGAIRRFGCLPKDRARRPWRQPLGAGCRVCTTPIASWKHAGQAGLVESQHGGRSRRVDAEGLRQLEALLARDPQELGEQATAWTVSLLLTHLSQVGYDLSEHTLRRTLHRLGWRWKRSRYELGRPDLAYALKKTWSWSR
jgi:transposase